MSCTLIGIMWLTCWGLSCRMYWRDKGEIDLALILAVLLAAPLFLVAWFGSEIKWKRKLS